MFGNAEARTLRNDVRQLTDANTILRKEIEALRRENAALRAGASIEPPTPLDIRVTQRGAIGIYGFRRFPIALFKQEAIAIIPNIAQLSQFIKENVDRLSAGPDDPRFPRPTGPRRIARR